MSQIFFRRIALFTTILAFLVVIFGAYVRLSNAGLGCPDWPGCYGHYSPIGVATFPTFEAHKAWKEMIHRYLAASLGLMILGLAIFSLRLKNVSHSVKTLPWILFCLVIFQALLGMWTVTLKLHPWVVMAHLLGGFTTLGLLWCLTLWGRGESCDRASQEGEYKIRPYYKFRFWILSGFILLILQILLGAWTSANYASLACPDFPTCQGKWIPTLYFKDAFGVWHEFDKNYEWGVLHNGARVTVHFLHRLGALIVFIYLGLLGLKIVRRKEDFIFCRLGILLLILLLAQISLGISNILFQLPLAVAVAHNAVAALLFLTLTALLLASFRKD